MRARRGGRAAPGCGGSQRYCLKMSMAPGGAGRLGKRERKAQV
jgi:hypothetical protein